MCKEFNFIGNCVPEKHYMADISNKINEIKPLIDSGKYLILNAARQFGKTTLLNEIRKSLKGNYLVIQLSFEGTDDTVWATTPSFCKAFAQKIGNFFKYSDYKKNTLANYWNLAEEKIQNFTDLSIAITDFCIQNQQKIVILIDEVDGHCENSQFLYFLGMLRNKYLYQINGQDKTFHSVIMSSQTDITNLKHEDSKLKNSPWNIAITLDLNLGLQPGEIEGMLSEYENDYKTGMDIRNMAEIIHKYSNGYPFLVSKLCWIIHEKLGKNFTEESVEKAINMLIKEPTPLFKDLTRHIAESDKYKELMTQLLLNRNTQISFDNNVPVLALAKSQSAIRENEHGNVIVHNIIFEKVLLSYFISNLAISNKFHIPNAQYAGTDKMNLELLISQFAQLPLHSKYNDEYISENWRLLFISFLKPIVNQMGFYYMIQNSTENLRMTIVARYSAENYIIELNDYYGSQFETPGEEILAKDITAQYSNKGYLITFNHAKKQENKSVESPEWVTVGNKMIYKAVM